MASFSVPLASLAARMKADVESVTRKATLDLFASVVRKSPVDTGRFRANWNVSYGAPDTTTTESTDRARADAEAARAAALPLGGTVFLCNGLSYSRRLEYGWSAQAPAGMVRLSAQEFADFVRKAVAEKA